MIAKVGILQMKTEKRKIVGENDVTQIALIMILQMKEIIIEVKEMIENQNQLITNADKEKAGDQKVRKEGIIVEKNTKRDEDLKQLLIFYLLSINRNEMFINKIKNISYTSIWKTKA